MLVIENLSHSFGDKIIYEDVNIRINKGEKIGLVGFNGSGKSTLINLLNGNILPDKGAIKWSHRHKIGYLDQYADIDRNMTIYEYLESAFSDLVEVERRYNEVNESMASADDEELIRLCELSGRLYDTLDEHNYYAIPSTINKVASGLGVVAIGLDKKVDELSGGQRAKVMLVKLLLEKPDLIILDEPTNFLDTMHVEWLEKYLNDFDGTCLIVSHDISFLNNVVNTIWSVEYSKIVRYNGDYQSYLVQREMKETLHDKMREAQLKEVDSLKDYIARNKARASTARMAKSREKKLEKIVVLDKIQQTSKPEFAFKYKSIASKVVVEVKDLCIGYEKTILSDISLSILNGDKVRIKGFNGVGKSTLLKTICGIIEPKGGTVKLAPYIKIGYYEQDLVWENDDITAVNEVRNAFPDLTEREIRTYLAKAGLDAKHWRQPIKSLSGGEQSKIKLCKLMIDNYSLLILDEPTNHLDVLAKESLADAIKRFGGTVIYVSHENDFADMVGGKVFDIEKLL